MGEKNTYRCPSWDEPITKDEIRRIEADYGPLANNLAGLAQLIREMDRIAPKIISLEDRIKVVVEPTAGAMGLRVEEWEIGNVADDLANGLDVESDLVAWQSRETVGCLMRILTSARKLRPQLELAIGAGQARDFYVDLHRTLEYVDHNCGKGLVIRMCMQWRGVDGSVKRLAGKVEHWQRNIVHLVKEERQPLRKLPAGRAKTDEPPNRVPWNEQDPAFYPNKQAIEAARRVGQEHDIDDLQTLDAKGVYKRLREPGCHVRFMSTRSPQPRGRVHRADWERFLKKQVSDSNKIENRVESEVRRRLQ